MPSIFDIRFQHTHVVSSISSFSSQIVLYSLRAGALTKTYSSVIRIVFAVSLSTPLDVIVLDKGNFTTLQLLLTLYGINLECLENLHCLNLYLLND